MTTEIVLLCLLGGLIALDTTAAFQILLSHPLVGCTLAGLVLRDVGMGLTVGILLELPWLLEIPVGGARFSEGNLGALIAAGVAILVNRVVERPEIVMLLALVYGIVWAFFIGKSVQGTRKLNTYLAHRADGAALRGEHRRVSSYHLLAIVTQFLLGIGITALSVAFGVAFLEMLVEKLPVALDASLLYTKMILMGVGLAAMVKLFYSKKMYIVIPVSFGLGVLALWL